MRSVRQSRLTFALVLLTLFTLLPPGVVTAAPHLRSDSATVQDRPSPDQTPTGSILGSDASIKSTSNYSFRDNFGYSNMSLMQSAGWTECGSPGAFPSDYRVTPGVLTLVTDYDNGTNTAVCWDKIPSGISNWSVSTRGAYVEGANEVAGTIQIVATTTSHRYAWAADGFFQRYILWRDGWGNGGVWTGPLYQAQLGVWHDMRMDFVKGVFHFYFDQLLMADVPVQDTGTNLTSIVLESQAGVDNSFAYVSANAVDPNAPDFTLVAGPTNQNIPAGQNATFEVSLASVNGFSGTINLDATVSPSGPNSVVASLIPTIDLSSGGSAQTSLTVSTMHVVSGSTFNIRINATIGTYVHAFQVSAVVVSPVQTPPFVLTVSPGSLVLHQGSLGQWTTQNVTIMIKPVSGFRGSVALSVSESSYAPEPNGAITPNQLLITDNRTYTASLYFPQGGGATEMFSVTAATAGYGIETNVVVNFVPSYFFTGVSPSSNLIVPIGSSDDFTLNLVSVNGDASNVTLSYRTIFALPANPPVFRFPTIVTLIPNGTLKVPITVLTSVNTPVGAYGFIIRSDGGWSMEDTQVNVYVVPHPYNPGVSIGTTATYTVSFSTLPNAQVSVTLIVTNVTGPVVDYTQQFYINNVLTNTTSNSLNVVTGDHSGTVYVPFPFVSANLRIGDKLYPAATYGSIDMSSASTSLLAGMSRSTVTGGTGLNIYLLPLQWTATWDESTGILGILDGTVPINSTDVTAHYRLESTNAWSSLLVELSSPVQAAQFSTITFTSHVSGGNPPYIYDWNFGDGQKSIQPNPVHRYLMPGNYEVTLRVTDSSGNVRTQTSLVKVTGLTSPSPLLTSLLSSRLLVPALVGLAVFASMAFSSSYFLIRRERVKQRRLAQQLDEH